MHYDQLFPRCCPVQTSDTFTKFQRLPPEIRNMIWEYALPESRVYEVLDAPNAKQKTPAQEGLMFANVHPEPPPALAAVCRESRSFVLHHYKPLTLGKTTKFVDMSRDILLLEPYLLVKRLHRTLHFMSQIPLVRDHATRLALGTSYGIYPGIFHPVLGRKVSKNNMGKLLASLSKFPRLKTLVFVVHQEFQFEFDFRFPGTLTPMPNYALPPSAGLGSVNSATAGYPSPPSTAQQQQQAPAHRPQQVHQAYRFKFDIESNINSPAGARRPHTNELLYYPLLEGVVGGPGGGGGGGGLGPGGRCGWDEFDEYERYVSDRSGSSYSAGGTGGFGSGFGLGGVGSGAGFGFGSGGVMDGSGRRWACPPPSFGGEGSDGGEEEEGEWCDPWPTNDDWRRFRRRWVRGMIGACAPPPGGGGEGASAGREEEERPSGHGKGCGDGSKGKGPAGKGRERICLPKWKLMGASLLWRYTRGVGGVQ
ncbi:hypothetical protein NEMBOFW57_002724 [Staphylotrichum longicolle]|uniref:2EXR domain-containing protein n=1 Tax=Staphylotrichum longicolle TaxID=669026 RepID=A0AAD4F6L2_9PEZI|nr:hypothetical protein NEMBOFW57_002724 [Staphylotrichum longicolle]